MSDDVVSRLNAALEGRYTVDRPLGEGGMATVYLAEDLKHERKVALKVLKAELAAMIGGERFVAEIKTTANLQHPHILPLFDSGEAGGFLYYVMPYIEGETLRDKLDRERQIGVEEALRLTRDVADALDYAHRNGIIHRDIKPENILLHDGRPVVADFGIAVAISAAGGGRMTETGLSLGTPHYMSPEQATADRDLSARSDVYSLACVLYEMLAGDPPHTGPTAQAILVRILTETPRSVTDVRTSVSPHVAAVLTKALEKLPADRFETAKEFADALENEGFTYSARKRTQVEPVAAAPAASVVPRASRTVPLLVGALVVALALAAWGWLGPAPPAPPLPVTRSSIDLGDLFLRTLGEILVSPDGSRFAAVGLDGLRPLYWRNADEEEFRMIPGTGGAEYASFSPDGQSLVFGTLAGGTLQRVALSGGAPQSVTELPQPDVGGLDWGDDGNIVYALGQGRGLFRVPATGGEPEVLLEPPTPVRNPKLLPGGRAVIFTSPDDLSTHILDLETDSVRVLRHGAIDAVYVETGHLLYTDVSGTLWAVAFDPREGEVIGEPVTVFDGITKPTPHYARYSVSRNGTLVYGAGGGGSLGGGPQLRLLVVDLDGNVEEPPLEPRNFAEPRWSPDGRSVVYRSRGVGDLTPDVFTYNMALGTTPRQLTFEGFNLTPVWSPDGTRVAFASQRDGTDGFDLFLKNVNDDSPPEMLLTLPDTQLPTHWPSDDLLIFENGARPDLWTLDLSSDSAVAREYLTSEYFLADMRVSPTGDLAVYDSDESGTTEIYVRSFPEPGARERVSRGGGEYPFWSPDGNTIYYSTTRGGGVVSLMAAQVQHGPPFIVTTTTSVLEGPYLPRDTDLHPDGDRIVVTRAATSASSADGAPSPERFVVVVNWFEELKARVGN